MNGEQLVKPVIWIRSSRKELREFPAPVQDHMGYALYVAQLGGKHRDAPCSHPFPKEGKGWGTQRLMNHTRSKTADE